MFNNLTYEQYEQLMKPLNENRIARRAGGGGRQLSYLETWDVKAHLIRIFGFGGWSWDVTAAELVFDQEANEACRDQPRHTVWPVALQQRRQQRCSEEDPGCPNVGTAGNGEVNGHRKQNH
jgi:hypothetical protein